MKKIGFIVLAAVAISQVACKRVCTQCTYQWELTNGQRIDTQQPEFCGKEADIEEYKREETYKAIQLAEQVGGKNVTLRCIDTK